MLVDDRYIEKLLGENSMWDRVDLQCIISFFRIPSSLKNVKHVVFFQEYVHNLVESVLC